MFSIIEPIIEVFEKKESLSLKLFIETFSKNSSWYLISDYCINDQNKNNDVFTFSLLLNHDKFKNIRDYINHFAPKDLKKTKNIESGMISYINSPVIYHFSFILKREEELLKGILNREYITDTIEWMDQIIKSQEDDKDGYFKSIIARIKLVKIELREKSFNEKLMRKILLTSLFGASIIYILKQYSDPSHIIYVSDRDSIIEKYDGFVYDSMLFWYKLVSINKPFAKSDPKLIFVEPEKTGENHFDELIRIPDFIAGTIASIDIEDKTNLDEMKDKHLDLFFGCFTNSKNQATLKIQYKNEIYSVYNFKWLTQE